MFSRLVEGFSRQGISGNPRPGGGYMLIDKGTLELLTDYPETANIARFKFTPEWFIQNPDVISPDL
jgi:hypothetical protein